MDKMDHRTLAPLYPFNILLKLYITENFRYQINLYSLFLSSLTQCVNVWNLWSINIDKNLGEHYEN